jgi:hypothetical protein
MFFIHHDNLFFLKNTSICWDNPPVVLNTTSLSASRLASPCVNKSNHYQARDSAFDTFLNRKVVDCDDVSEASSQAAAVPAVMIEVSECTWSPSLENLPYNGSTISSPM